MCITHSVSATVCNPALQPLSGLRLSYTDSVLSPHSEVRTTESALIVVFRIMTIILMKKLVFEIKNDAPADLCWMRLWIRWAHISLSSRRVQSRFLIVCSSTSFNGQNFYAKHARRSENEQHVHQKMSSRRWIDAQCPSSDPKLWNSRLNFKSSPQKTPHYNRRFFTLTDCDALTSFFSRHRGSTRDESI